MISVGRNDPCPCGSGKKYKKCCLEQSKKESPSRGPEKVFTDLRQALHEQEFTSIEEVQAFAGNFMRQKNQTALEDFQGLSPEQMRQMLDFPFSSPQLVSFPDILTVEPSAPILTLFSLLIGAIGKEGLKATAKGNLPRDFCREAWQSYCGKEASPERMRFYDFKINKEEEFDDLNVARIISEMSGMLRKFKGRFVLSKLCQNMMSEHGLAGVYPRLFKTFATKFNWAYGDGYPDLVFIQRSFLYTLYLLHKFGNDWRPQLFYEDCFLRAFPSILNEIAPNPILKPEEMVRSCYTLRTLVRFLRFFGLVDLESEDISYRKQRVKKLPLLYEVFRFNL